MQFLQFRCLFPMKYSNVYRQNIILNYRLQIENALDYSNDHRQSTTNTFKFMVPRDNIKTCLIDQNSELI